MATLEELKTKLQEARALELIKKQQWESSKNDIASAPENIANAKDQYLDAKAARKLLQREVDDFKPTAPAGPVTTTAPKKDNASADLLWAQWLRKQGRRPFPRPAGWGE